jgi:transcriptional regulator with XRE-family HTH domain
MKPYDRAVIAEKLTQLREERGLTRNQVADALGLSLSAIAGYEQARRTPKYDNLKNLAKLYKVPLESILGQEGQQEVVIVKENKIEDAILESFILRTQELCKEAELSSREKREELELLLDFLEMRIKKKLKEGR